MGLVATLTPAVLYTSNTTAFTRLNANIAPDWFTVTPTYSPALPFVVKDRSKYGLLKIGAFNVAKSLVLAVIALLLFETDGPSGPKFEKLTIPSAYTGGQGVCSFAL